MYAVGGNAEAASVSGISVFKVTLGVFIMAGIFYGFGAFLRLSRQTQAQEQGRAMSLMLLLRVLSAEFHLTVE